MKHVEPEDLLTLAGEAFSLAREGEGDGNPLSGALSTNGTLLYAAASILDRLDRILTLLDERLPPMPREPSRG